MRKQEFLKELNNKLSKYPSIDKEDILQYYNELIEDKIENTRKSEEEVIEELGSIDSIVQRTCENVETKKKLIVEETIEDEKKKDNENTILKIIVLILTFPFWIGIVVGAIGILIGIISASVGIACAGICTIIYGIFTMFKTFIYGLFQVGVGMICLGIACIITPYIIKLMKLVIELLKKITLWIFKGGSKNEN